MVRKTSRQIKQIRSGKEQQKQHEAQPECTQHIYLAKLQRVRPDSECCSHGQMALAGGTVQDWLFLYQKGCTYPAGQSKTEPGSSTTANSEDCQRSVFNLLLGLLLLRSTQVHKEKRITQGCRQCQGSDSDEFSQVIKKKVTSML